MACKRFIYVENLSAREEPRETARAYDPVPEPARETARSGSPVKEPPAKAIP